MNKLTMGLVFGFLCVSLASAAKAPDFSLKTPDGKRLALSDYSGKVVVVNFWATWCPPCRAEIPDFVEVYNDLKDKGLVVVGITLDDAPEKIRAVMVDKKITYPVVVADQAALSRYGGINAVPTTFIVDRKGNLVSRQVGAMDKKMLEELVKKLL